MYADPVAGVYKKLVLSDDAQTLLGGVLVGDAQRLRLAAPDGRRSSSAPTRPPGCCPRARRPRRRRDLPDDANVCSCNNVTAGHDPRAPCSDEGCTDLAGVKACTKAGTSCGSCLPLVKKLVTTELEKSGVTVSNALCEHFELSAGRSCSTSSGSPGCAPSARSSTSTARGRGCDICRPVVASILASLGTGHVLDGDQARLQDTNDHVMANLQKDGTYSVVPRVPGGEITPEGLIDDRPGRRGLRALHQDHRRPADRPVRRPARAAAGDLAAAGRRRASSPGTPTARRCGR